MEITIFTYIVLLLSSLMAVLASFYALKQLRRSLPDNNEKEKISRQTRYWVGGYLLFFLATQIFEDTLEAKFAGGLFNYIDERPRIIGIMLLVFIFMATVFGVIRSNLEKQHKSHLVASHLVFVASIISLFTLGHMASDYFL